MTASSTPSKLVLGISSCLLGQEVRYDGGHKYDHYINGSLKPYFDFLPICPEVLVGLPVPRPPIQLVARGKEIHVVGVDNPEIDVTESLYKLGRKVSEEQEEICGYIFKSRSPSCGPDCVDIHDSSGRVLDTGAGGYAYSLIKHLPLLPVLHEEQLGDAKLRENFITRVFVYFRWKQLLNSGLSVAALQAFHAKHKYLVMAHNQGAYKNLGKMLADADEDSVKVISCLYMEELMNALKSEATAAQHVNVLQHIMGYLKNDIGTEEKNELLESFEQFSAGKVPILVPMTLLKHYFHLYPNDYIAQQVYLYPHPTELMLHNRA